MSKSCVGCKYLYAQDEGYSNYTVMNTAIYCALDANPNLPGDEPYDWIEEPDNWPKTMESRCAKYSAGVKVCLDCDGFVGPADETDDAEAIAAICAHSGREPHGDNP